MRYFSTLDCPAYILAGGQSQRFGSDKARVLIHSTPQLVQLMDQLSQQLHTVKVVADRADRYADLGIESLVDLEPDAGPLAGLATALAHRATQGPGWLLLVSCDQLRWKKSWFDQLCDISPQHLASIFEAEQLQPIPGLYHSDLSHIATTNLAHQNRSLKRLLSQVADRCHHQLVEDNPRNWCFNDPSELTSIL